MLLPKRGEGSLESRGASSGQERGALTALGWVRRAERPSRARGSKRRTRAGNSLPEHRRRMTAWKEGMGFVSPSINSRFFSHSPPRAHSAQRFWPSSHAKETTHNAVIIRTLITTLQTNIRFGSLHVRRHCHCQIDSCAWAEPRLGIALQNLRKTGNLKAGKWRVLELADTSARLCCSL